MPRITVLTTLYNKGPFVEEAVRSVLASTFADFEMLVVDDGSTDGGPEKVAAIADARVRLLRSPANTGRPAAANRGLAAARGEYIAILDADDLMHPERLAKQAAFLDAHPEIGVVGSSLGVLGKEEQWHWPEGDREARGKMLFGDPACYPATMMRRSAVEEHGVRCDERWLTPGMDYLFMLSMAEHVGFANLREPLTVYRVGEQNMRHGRDPVEDRAIIYREAFRRFGIPATEDEVRCQLMLHRLWKQPPDAAQVRALHGWIGKLKRINRERALFDAEVFEGELDRLWNARFHAFADASLGAGLAHLRLSRSLDPGRWRYLAATAARRWMGRAA